MPASLRASCIKRDLNLTALIVPLIANNAAGQIDKGHHLTEPLLALTEVLSLDLAVAKAQELTTSDDTLIVVTADHGHAFTMGGKARRGANIFGRCPPTRNNIMHKINWNTFGTPNVFFAQDWTTALS